MIISMPGREEAIGHERMGRTLAYSPKERRMAMMGLEYPATGCSGDETAPKRVASADLTEASVSSGRAVPSLWKTPQPATAWTNSNGSPVASNRLRPAEITS
jgi:hypothetical protein